MTDTDRHASPSAAPSSHDTDDVVFTFSFETWADAARRGMMRPPDRLASMLMTSDRVRRLIVANPYRWLPRIALAPLLERDAGFPASNHVFLHRPARVRRSERFSVPDLAAEYAAYDASLGRQVDRRGLVDPLVLTCNPLVAGFAPLHWAAHTTYFARDDWLSSPARRPYWPAFSDAYRRIAESGRAVAAVSAQIIERIAPTGPHEVVPNGVEAAEWLAPMPAEPGWLAAVPHPRAVYVGTLDGRLDVEGTLALARDRPDLHIVLVGPLPDPSYIAALRAAHNVHVHPSVGRAELIATLRHSDVALVAHRRTALTEAMSPLKLYEYLAAGLPVLSIDLPPVRGISDRVTLVDTVADFTDVLDQALTDGAAPDADRVAFVEDNSWASRHTRVLALMRRQ